MVSDYDLNMSLGGKFKLLLNYSDNLFEYENVIDQSFMMDLTSSIEIEFDPTDSTIFFFTTTEGLFKVDKKMMDKQAGQKPVKMDTMGLNSPTAISLCDKGYLLAAYSCGSIW